MEKATGMTLSTNLQKAVIWVGEIMAQHPEKQRSKIIEEAQLRFDLTPMESEFLHNNFIEIITPNTKEE